MTTYLHKALHHAQIDVQRRDFTVNALFFELTEGRLVDLVSGVDDLRSKTLRTVIGAVDDMFGLSSI